MFKREVNEALKLKDEVIQENKHVPNKDENEQEDATNQLRWQYFDEVGI